MKASPEVFCKKDLGKPMISLVEPSFIIGLAEVLTFGAKKYSNYGIMLNNFTELEKAWTVNNVVRVIKLTQSSSLVSAKAATLKPGTQDLSANTVIKESQYMLSLLWSAETATIDALKSRTLSIDNANLTIQEPTQLSTKTDCAKLTENEIKTLKEKPNIRLQDGQIDSRNSTLLKSSMIVTLRLDVESAELYRNIPTLTTATIQENSEVSFVVSATTDLGCLGIIYKVLDELSLISKPLKQVVVKTGIDNWKSAKTVDIRRLKDSLLRHTLAYTGGEVLDPETGLSHAYHIGCNVMFLDYLLTHKDG